MNFAEFLFCTVAALTGLCAVAVVVTQNIVRAAAWLLFTLCGVAGIFFLLGADFVGATQLLVYVGGTLVLVVFGVMLTAQGPLVGMRTSAAEWAISTFVGLLLFSVLTAALVNARYTEKMQQQTTIPEAAQSRTGEQLGAALLGVEQATPPANVTGLPATVPVRARTAVAYLLPFEIVSVHLLVVLIGAAYLARAKRRRGAAA